MFCAERILTIIALERHVGQVTTIGALFGLHGMIYAFSFNKVAAFFGCLCISDLDGSQLWLGATASQKTEGGFGRRDALAVVVVCR